MLFRPSADQNLAAIHAMLDGWNAEADRFRQAAIAARKGEAPTPLVVAAAEEAHDGLMSLLDELDVALDKVKPGTPHFADVLHAQMTAVALLESLGNSYDSLDRFLTGEAEGPTRARRQRPVEAA